jgi:hypothetical protein
MNHRCTDINKLQKFHGRIQGNLIYKSRTTLWQIFLIPEYTEISHKKQKLAEFFSTDMSWNTGVNMDVNKAIILGNTVVRPDS